MSENKAKKEKKWKDERALKFLFIFFFFPIFTCFVFAFTIQV